MRLNEVETPIWINNCARHFLGQFLHFYCDCFVCVFQIVFMSHVAGFDTVAVDDIVLGRKGD